MEDWRAGLMMFYPTVEAPISVVQSHPHAFALAAGGLTVIVDPDSVPAGNGVDRALVLLKGEYVICSFFRCMGQVVLLPEGRDGITVPESAFRVEGKVIAILDTRTVNH
jgi:hypothetical protein